MAMGIFRTGRGVGLRLRVSSGVSAALFAILFVSLVNCNVDGGRAVADGTKLRLIFDTDANNEVDDQHALAYLLFSGNHFEVEGVTVNATWNGGDIDDHYAEAKRVMQLSASFGDIPLLRGANGSFQDIEGNLAQADYDGVEAVSFIIERAMVESNDTLVLLAVGKLTNIALALKKEPAIASRVHVVWLGSNYPEPGEYNQDNDTEAMPYLLDANVPFHMVTVRYGRSSGTTAVRVTQAEMLRRMPGKGPRVSPAVPGRHGGVFETFGDYSVSLFENFVMRGDPPSRSLYDMAAVAVLKNRSWAERRQIPAPTLIENEWVDRPENARSITLWENFDIYGIMNDFFLTMEEPVLVGSAGGSTGVMTP
jgi:purine nucleosidase